MVHGANIILCKASGFVRSAKERISAPITILDFIGKGKKIFDKQRGNVFGAEAPVAAKARTTGFGDFLCR